MKKALAAFLMVLALASLASAQTKTRTAKEQAAKPQQAKAVRVNTGAKDYSDSVILGVGYSFAAFEFDEAQMKGALVYDLSYHKFFNKYIGLGLSGGYYEADSEIFTRPIKEINYTVRSIHVGPKLLLRFPIKYGQTDMEPYAGAGVFYFLNKISVTSGDFDEGGGAVGGGLEAGFKVYKGGFLFGLNAARYLNRQKLDEVTCNLDRTDFKLFVGVSF